MDDTKARLVSYICVHVFNATYMNKPWVSKEATGSTHQNRANKPWISKEAIGIEEKKAEDDREIK